MSFVFDPNYNSVDVFHRCTDRRPYKKNELYEAIPDTPSCIPLLNAVPVSLVGGNITLSGVTINTFEYEYYYYTNDSGANLYATGERLTRAYNTDGVSITEYWFGANDVLGSAPASGDIVPEGEPYPISTVSSILNEAPTIFSLSPSSLNVTMALIQIKSNSALLANSYTVTVDNILVGDLVRWRLDGVAPTVSNSYFAGHGSIIKLDGKEQIANFRLISRTDSIAYGSDIRPELTVTYFIGIDKK